MQPLGRSDCTDWIRTFKKSKKPENKTSVKSCYFSYNFIPRLVIIKNEPAHADIDGVPADGWLGPVDFSVLSHVGTGKEPADNLNVSADTLVAPKVGQGRNLSTVLNPHIMFIIICIFITYINIINRGQNEFILQHSMVRISLYINIITTFKRIPHIILFKSILVGSNSSETGFF